MGWQYFLMKHGIGSPGYIARRMAKYYRAIREAKPGWDERAVLNAVYAHRVAAQSVLGGPIEYQMTRKDPALKHAVLEENPDLFSIIRHAILIEHPEMQNPHAPPNRFEILDRVLSEVLNREIPGWRDTAPKSGTATRGTLAGTDSQPRFDLTVDEWFQIGITYFVTGRWDEPIASNWRSVPRAWGHSECEAEDCVFTVVRQMREAGVLRRNLRRQFYFPIQILLMACRYGDFLTIQKEPAFSRTGQSNFARLYDAYAYGSGGEAGFHEEWKHIQEQFGAASEEGRDMVTFVGGPGLTKETALRIQPVPDRVLSHRTEAEPIVTGEYWYLAYKFGKMGIDWKCQSQALLKRDEAGKMYDRLDIECTDGEPHQIYFDISHLPY